MNKHVSTTRLYEKWPGDQDQTCTMNDVVYDITAAHKAAAGLHVFDLDIRFINRQTPSCCNGTFMDFVSHVAAVNNADLEYPIILNQNAAIIDGRHRLAKAILLKKATIKAVMFKLDPPHIFITKP